MCDPHTVFIYTKGDMCAYLPVPAQILANVEL